MRRVHPVLLLLIVALLAYGLLIPGLGFYWDDLAISWISYELGEQALRSYFSSNRPVWGWLFQITNNLIPQIPIYWQMFAFAWRWLGAVMVWAIARKLRGDNQMLAMSLGLVFLLYPGFNQQWISYLYSHVFIVLAAFLLSIYLMLLGGWFYTMCALLLSAMNLWMHEYFFLLEAVRPALIWIALQNETIMERERRQKTLLRWLPYLMVFAAAILYRLFVFNNQVYGIGLQDQVSGDRVKGILYVVQEAVTSLWTSTVAAWAQIFRFPDPVVDGPRISTLFGLVVLMSGLAAFLAISTRKNTEVIKASNRRQTWWMIGLGFAMLALGGAPWWLTGNPISLNFPASRALISFVPGASLLTAGLLEFIPGRMRQVALIVLTSLAAGFQFLTANEYRNDWEAQKDFFWQMKWRAPAMAAGTLVFTNEELAFYADNSLASALNWIYAPQQPANELGYALMYPLNRLGGSLPSLEADVPIEYDYLVGKFVGNTSASVAFYYDPPGCLRLLDAEIDPYNRLIPADNLMRDASELSDPSLILSDSTIQLPDIYYPEPAHGWCYFFERADLARQLQDWQLVTELGESALALDDHPNDPIERFVFIEGFAHAGDWARAEDLSEDSYRVSKEYMGPLLCRLWQRIEANTTADERKTEIVEQVKTNYACNW